MSNLVEHLRDSGMHPLCEDAADEIERLERELTELRIRLDAATTTRSYEERTGRVKP